MNLLNCPFCNSSAELHMSESECYSEKFLTFYVGCTKCPTSLGQDERLGEGSLSDEHYFRCPVEAEKAWNTRFNQPNVPDQQRANARPLCSYYCPTSKLIYPYRPEGGSMNRDSSYGTVLFLGGSFDGKRIKVDTNLECVLMSVNKYIPLNTNVVKDVPTHFSCSIEEERYDRKYLKGGDGNLHVVYVFHKADFDAVSRLTAGYTRDVALMPQLVFEQTNSCVEYGELENGGNYSKTIQTNKTASDLRFRRIPQEIHAAAEALRSYFEMRGDKDWQFAHVADSSLAIRLGIENETLKTRHAALMLHTQSVVDENARLRERMQCHAEVLRDRGDVHTYKAIMQDLKETK